MAAQSDGGAVRSKTLARRFSTIPRQFAFHPYGVSSLTSLVLAMRRSTSRRYMRGGGRHRALFTSRSVNT
jgi:hypothetical protein